MAEHTPTAMNSDMLPRPWFTDDVGSTDSVRVFLGDPSKFMDWQEVAMCSADATDGVSLQSAIANAEFIVRCVNAHDELVAALDDAHLLAGALMISPGDPKLVAQDAERIYLMAEALLAKARGES